MKKFYTTLIIFTFTAAFSFAQIEIDIADGMTVETTGSVYISGVTDVIENTTGYLKGTVESSTLSGATQFAGLNLSSGFNGTITRTTGTAFSGANPTSTLRSYEMNNTGSLLTTNVDAKIITDVNNNEENGITDKFIYTEESGTWTGYTDNNSTENIIKAAGVTIPNGTSNIVISEGVGVAAKIFLEGPYQGGITPMTSSLTLPGNSPFTLAKRSTTPPAGAVDWVLVELRSGTAGSSSLGYRAAFVDAQGNLIDDDGNAGIGLPATPGNRHIVIKHRNHLAVMSNLIHNIDWSSAP